ncbi:glycosyltransferase family 4 protein [bacterium]|nr:glycosyltransferase family 4 protein [bacterium]
MRIGLLCPEPVGAGGIGTYTGTLARALADEGHDVRVLLPVAPVPEEKGPCYHGLAFPSRYRLPAFNRAWGLSTALLPWARHAAEAVRALHAEHPFDVIEVPEWMAGGLFLKPGRTLPALVVRLHTHLALVRRLNDLPMTLDARLASSLEARALRHASMVLANSAALADAVSIDYRIPRKAIDVLHLGVDVERFSVQEAPALKRSLGLEPTETLALFVGRIERRKGADTLVEAFAAAAAKVSGLHLAVAGGDTMTAPDGTSLREHLASRLMATGYARRLHWLGPRDHRELPELYAGCDFFVAPSRLEPFGLVYLEAMAAGKPVIGCAAGGVPEIVQDGMQGVLVPPANAKALAEALVLLATDPKRRQAMGERARARALAFDHRALASRTAACYLEARARHAKGRHA